MPGPACREAKAFGLCQSSLTALKRYETTRLKRTTDIVQRSTAMAGTFHNDQLIDPEAGASSESTIRITHIDRSHARARGDPASAVVAPSRPTGSSRRCGCWRRRHFVLAELLFADSGSGATMELGRSARPPMLLLPAPRSGTGSSTNDWKFCSTDRGGACSRSRSAAAAGVLNDHQNLAELPILIGLTRARISETRRPSTGPPLLNPFYKRVLFQRTSTRQQLDCAKTL
jgi:hypothetical protein